MRNVIILLIMFVLINLGANAGLVLECNPSLTGEVTAGEYTVSVSTDGVEPESELWIALWEYKPVYPYQSLYVADIGKSLNYLSSDWEIIEETLEGDIYYWILVYEYRFDQSKNPFVGKIIELALDFPLPESKKYLDLFIQDDSQTVTEHLFTVIPEPATLFLFTMGTLILRQKRVISG